MVSRQLSPLRIVPTKVRAKLPSDRADIAIYKPFFLSGILSVLTAGCMLGAIALLGISIKGDYLASAWTPYVLAHANSQLFGWVGFFIIGFALQQHATTVAKSDTFHRIAYWILGLLAAGIALRFVAEPMSKVDRGVWVPVGVGACLLQLAAVVLFMYNTTANRYRAGGPLTWQSLFVFGSLFWMLVISIAEPIFFAMSHQASPEAAIMFVAKWFAPYREAQFLGFAAMMIFGVSLVKFHTCFGLREANAKLGILAFGLWMVGLLMRIFGWIMYFDGMLQPEKAWMFRLGAVSLALGAVAAAGSLGVFEPVRETFRSQKFVRAAFVWLLASGVMLALEPIHLNQIGMPFSHAFTGATRHAVTVGFISQMIIGVGMHVVARLNGLAEDRLPALWSVFWLLNLGNTGRVVLEVATDYTPRAFTPMGITGFVELTALAIWGFHVARPMLARFKEVPAHVC